MKKILTKIFAYVPILLLVLSIILVVQMTVSVKKGEAPTIFGRAGFYVETQSMEPTIMAGDVVFVNTHTDTYHIGDIITFYRPDMPEITITHRIVDIQTKDGVLYYTTKGDNNSSSEDWEVGFTQNYIIGKYISKSAFIGGLYRDLFVRQDGNQTTISKNYIFLGLILVFVIIGGMEFVNLIKTIGNEKAKKITEEKERLIAEELEKLKKQQEESDKK